MKVSFPKLQTWSMPNWLQSDHPGFRAIIALVSVVFVIIQVFGNLPDSALRQSMQPARNAFDELGLYERGWGMFAATNTSTTVVRNELTYADGSVQEIQYVQLAPGYALSVWNEVMQDLQFDDNNDVQGRYLAGFLRYTCNKYNRNPENPLITVAFQQQFTRLPEDKGIVAKQNPFTTKQLRQCQ